MNYLGRFKDGPENGGLENLHLIHHSSKLEKPIPLCSNMSVLMKKSFTDKIIVFLHKLYWKIKVSSQWWRLTGPPCRSSEFLYTVFDKAFCQSFHLSLNKIKIFSSVWLN
jgi:hypothetical protein